MKKLTNAIVVSVGQRAKRFLLWQKQTFLLILLCSPLWGFDRVAHGENSLEFQEKYISIPIGLQFESALPGRFLAGACQQILAKNQQGTDFALFEGNGSRVSVSGIELKQEQTKEQVLDLNNDGLSDLFSLSRDGRQYQVFLNLGAGRFQGMSRDLLLPGDPFSAGFKLGVIDSPQLLTIANDEQLFVFSFESNRGLQTVAGFPRQLAAPLIAVLNGVRDRSENDILSVVLNKQKQSRGRIFRLAPDGPRTWADFPDEIDFGKARVGDLNVDGYDDVLFPSSILGTWWIALGEGDHALEYPLSPSFGFSGRSVELEVSDIDCDSRPDLLNTRIQPGGIQYFVSTRLPSPPYLSSSMHLHGRALSDKSGPYVCVGYLPESATTKWGYYRSCPRGYAIFDSIFFKDYVAGSCCRLPADDILQGEQLDGGFLKCPENSLATGVELPGKLRCTKINEKRYLLSKEQAGVYWGYGSRQFRERRTVQKANIPLGLRYGIGRDQFQSWHPEGCLGYPWGAILSGWGPETCQNTSYRTLLYLGKEGDPPRGTPVPMFPSCKTGVNPYDPDAGCFE